MAIAGAVIDPANPCSQAGVFTLYWSDFINHPGVFFADPVEGQARREVICKVFQNVSDLLQPRTGCPLGNVTLDINGVDDPARIFGGLGGSNFNTAIGNFVYQQLNFSTFSPTTVLGNLTINFNYDFNTNFSSTNIGFNIVDLYTVGLHEVLHILGFSGQFSFVSTPSLSHVSPLVPLMTVMPNDIPLFNGLSLNPDPVISSNLVSSNCTAAGPSVVVRTCHKDVPVDMSSSSHLNNKCFGTLEAYVMSKEIPGGITNLRAPHQDEINILIRMGYNVEDHFGVIGENNYREYQENDNITIQEAMDDNALPPKTPLCGNIEYISTCIENVLQPVDINLNDLMINDINVSAITNLRVTDNSGTLEQISSNNFTFTPCPFFSGRAILSYDIIPSNSECLTKTKNSANVYITIENCVVTNVNLTSTCNGNTNIPVIVSPFGSNPFGLMISNPTVLNGSGTIDLITTTSFRFTPCPFFEGIAELSYQINTADPNCGSTTNLVHVNVDNCLPTLSLISTCNGLVNRPVIINPLGVNANAIIDNLNINNSFGTIDQINGNSFRFTPFPNFHGIATLNYDIVPNSGDCSRMSEQINITVNKCASTSTNYDLSPCDLTTRGWVGCGTNLNYDVSSNPSLLELHKSLDCNLVCNPEFYFDRFALFNTLTKAIDCSNPIVNFPIFDRTNKTENLIPGWRTTSLGGNTPDYWSQGISSDISKTDENGFNGNLGILNLNGEEVEGTLQNRMPNKNYLFSVYLQNFALNDASIHISLKTDREDLNPIKILDNESFLSDQYQRFITKVNLSNLPAKRDLERINFKIKNGDGYSYVTFDQVELVPDNFTAGPDKIITCGQEVTLGLTTCGDLSNTLYEWFTVSASGVEISVRPPSFDPTFIVAPSTRTKYRVKRTFSTFDNGTNSINPNPTIYQNGGITTTNIKMQDDVVVGVKPLDPPLSPNFSKISGPGPCGNCFQFEAEDKSIGSIHTWEILSGSNIVATLTGIIINYCFPFSGTFKVRHTISIGSCKMSTSKNFTALSFTPNSEFTINNLGCNIFSLQPINTSNNFTHQWIINDDGVITTFNTQNVPSLAFSNSPQRTIRITHRITRNNNACSSELTMEINIIIPDADFDFKLLTGCNRFEFKSNQNEDGFIHSWNFGDGSTSSDVNPIHQYASNISVNPIVSHTITVNGCETVLNKVIDINFLNPDFIYLNSGICNQYKFIPDDLDDVRDHSWDFGDGTASEEASPSHQFPLLDQDVTYNVKHFIHELYNCNTSIILPVFVPRLPDASFTHQENVDDCFTFDFVSTETRDEVVFNFGGVETPVEVEHTWLVDNVQVSTDPNPSISFTPGWHTVLHKVKIADCDLFENKRIFAGVDANFKVIKNCNDLRPYNEINFSTNTNEKEVIHSWNFGDLSPLSNAVNPVHTYPIGNGTFIVTHTVTAIEDENCINTITQYVYIRDPDFTIMKSTTICNEYSFVPIAAPSIPALTHSWFAIGGTMGSNQNPQILSGGALYSIYHQIDYSDGDNHYCVSVTKPETTVTFDASFNEQHTCNNYTFTSTPSTSLPIGTLHSWDFGDGSPFTPFSTNSSSQHTYNGSNLNPMVKHTVRIDGCDYIFNLIVNIAPNSSAPFNISGIWTSLTNSDNVNPNLFIENQCIIPGACGTPIQTSAANPNLFFRFQNPASKGFQLIFKYGNIEGIDYGTIAAPTFKLFKLNIGNNTLDLITQRDYTISDRLKISYYDDDPNAIFYVEASNISTNYGSFTVCFSDEPGNDVIQGAFEIKPNMIANNFNDLSHPLNRSTMDILGLNVPNETDKYLTSFENKNADWYNTKIDGEQNGKNVWFKFKTTTGNIDIQQLNRNLNIGADNTISDNGNPRLRLYDWNDVNDNNLLDENELTLIDSREFNLEGIRIGYSGLETEKNYYLSVSDFPGYEGNFTLRLFDTPSNDFIQGAYRIKNEWIVQDRSSQPINLNMDFISITNPLHHPELDASLYFSPFTNLNKSYLPTTGLTISKIDGPKVDGVLFNNQPLGPHFSSNQNSWFVFNTGLSSEIEIQAISQIVNGIDFGSMAYPTLRLYDYDGNTNTFTLLNSTNVLWNKATLSYAGLQTNKDYYISISNSVDITGNGSFTIRLFRAASNDILQGAYPLIGAASCYLNPSTENLDNSNLDTYLGPFNTYNGNYHGEELDGDLMRCRNHWFKILPNSICNIELVENGADMNTAALYSWTDINNNGDVSQNELSLIVNKTNDEINNFHIDIPNPSLSYLYMVGQPCNGPLIGQFSICVNQCSGILPKATEQNNNVGSLVLTVFPNPNDGQFRVKLVNINSNYISVQLVDMYGKLVKNLFEETKNEQPDIEISVNKDNLAAGVYFIVSKTNQKTISKKVIIE